MPLNVILNLIQDLGFDYVARKETQIPNQVRDDAEGSVWSEILVKITQIKVVNSNMLTTFIISVYQPL